MNDEEEISLNLPVLRVWELNENSTRYDKLVAAPSDSDMYFMWVFWSLIMGIVAVVSGFIFVAILKSPKSRKNPSNTYLLGLILPDTLMSLLCCATCWINAATGHFYSEGLCYFQSFFFIFGICANSYLNAMIARQLYRMLRAAHSFEKIPPLTHRCVLKEAGLVYLWSSFVASWGLWDTPWWPHKTGLVLGTACIPIDYDVASSIFFYCVFFPVLMGGPLCYVLYVIYRIYKDNLMPRTGKRRVLSIYFLRLAIVFVVMWIPALLFLFILGPWVHHWVVWAGGAWSHLQGLVSSLMALLKPDVIEACRDLWPFPMCSWCPCRSIKEEEEDDDEVSWDGGAAESKDVEAQESAPENRRGCCLWYFLIQKPATDTDKLGGTISIHDTPTGEFSGGRNPDSVFHDKMMECLKDSSSRKSDDKGKSQIRISWPSPKDSAVPLEVASDGPVVRPRRRSHGSFRGEALSSTMASIREMVEADDENSLGEGSEAQTRDKSIGKKAYSSSVMVSMTGELCST